MFTISEHRTNWMCLSIFLLTVSIVWIHVRCNFCIYTKLIWLHSNKNEMEICDNDEVRFLYGYPLSQLSWQKKKDYDVEKEWRNKLSSFITFSVTIVFTILFTYSIYTIEVIFRLYACVSVCELCVCVIFACWCPASTDYIIKLMKKLLLNGKRTKLMVYYYRWCYFMFLFIRLLVI